MLPTARQQDATRIQTRASSTRRRLLFATALLAIGFGAIYVSKEDSSVFARASSRSFVEPLLTGPEIAVVKTALEHDRDFGVTLFPTAEPGAVKQTFSDGGYFYYETR